MTTNNTVTPAPVAAVLPVAAKRRGPKNDLLDTVKETLSQNINALFGIQLAGAFAGCVVSMEAGFLTVRENGSDVIKAQYKLVTVPTAEQVAAKQAEKVVETAAVSPEPVSCAPESAPVAAEERANAEIVPSQPSEALEAVAELLLSHAAADLGVSGDISVNDTEDFSMFENVG